MYEGFVASGGNQLTGQRIESPGDLAALAQVYRDPRFETFRVVYVSGDTVVGTMLNNADAVVGVAKAVWGGSDSDWSRLSPVTQPADGQCPLSGAWW